MPPIDALIYARVSTLDQATEGTSLDTQLAACRAYCAERGYQIVGEYQDVHTGAQWRERPGLTALRERLREGGIAVVLCHALDRLSRDQTHLAVLVDAIEYAGARLELVTETFEDSAVGKFIRSAKAFAAEVEREKFVERSTRGRRARVESGKPLPGARPLYGYRWRDEEKTGLEIDPQTGPVAARILREAQLGRPLRAIARGLSADGILTPTGKAIWSHETVRRILKHPGYTGRAYGWAWRAPSGRFNPVFDAEQAIALPPGTIPPLIDLENWERIQERLRANQRRAARNNRRPHVALMRAGLAVCGHCGHAMIVHYRASRTGLVYECDSRYRKGTDCRSHTIVVHKVDTAVWAALVALLTEPGFVARELERRLNDDPTGADLKDVERRLARVTREQRNLIAQLGHFSDPDAGAAVRAAIEDLGRQKGELERERAQIMSQRAVWEEAQHYLADLDTWVATMAHNLPDLNYEEKRELLEYFGFRVTIWRADHAPRFEIESRFDLRGLPIATTSGASCGHNRVIRLRWTDQSRAAD